MTSLQGMPLAVEDEERYGEIHSFGSVFIRRFRTLNIRACSSQATCPYDRPS